MNKVIISGRLTKEVKARSVGDKLVVELTIAHNKAKKGKDGSWQSEPHYFDIVAWDTVAKRITEAGIEKGDMIIVEGVLNQERWEGKNGEKKEKVKIYADRVFKVSIGSNKDKKEDINIERVDVVEDDDVPF